MSDASNSWFGPADSRFEDWEAPSSKAPSANRSSFARLWRSFMSMRVTLASVLLVLQTVIFAMGSVISGWSIVVCAAYLLATLAVRVWGNPKPPSSTFDAQWVSTIGVDVVTFCALNFLQATGINYTPLFALPVLLASILGPILLALGTASTVTLLLLVEAWWLSLQAMGDLAGRFLQAGLSGLGFILVALLANQLALRVAREEHRARASQSVARMQTRINELVVESLSDGVLVIDASGTVRSANPASRRLLSNRDSTRLAPFALASNAVWLPLLELMQQTFSIGLPQQADISLQHLERTTRHLHVRTQLVTSRDNIQESLCVMFLEDLREMEARVRTEKMAAMGRMSAAVAHEIRNPLAAISQANALLEEEMQQPRHRQLTGMVRQNAQRLAKIVDEILNISRVQVPSAEQSGRALVLDEVVIRIISDWARQNSCKQLAPLAPGVGRAMVAFDPDHLRRLMINLLDNALRYASQNPGAIEVATQLVGSSGPARLSVWSDGAPLEKTVQAHLFEPFFSSESRSSGLGLYICRELCERYGALIGYQRALRRSVEGNEFFVIFKAAEGPAASPSTFDTLLA